MSQYKHDFQNKKGELIYEKTVNRTHSHERHTDYKIVTWLDNALPDATVTITSGKTTYRFTGSYDGDHALAAKLLTHMTSDNTVKG